MALYVYLFGGDFNSLSLVILCAASPQGMGVDSNCIFFGVLLTLMQVYYKKQNPDEKSF